VQRISIGTFSGLEHLISNCLARLQAVLTPNLPQDPTVDEMRNYLEYIQEFKNSEVGSEPLSLQEQTFLAQKQLEKYFLEKYIKSIAVSKHKKHICIYIGTKLCQTITL